jgi:predicted SnoaL-like aldol condensation-catalyzing enzyme
MKTKQEIWDEIVNNSAYKIVSQRIDPKEKQAIEALLGGKFLDTLFEFESFTQRVKADPELQSEFVRALSGGNVVLKAESSTTGSTG